MEGLPDEVIELIFDYLSVQQLLKLLTVCKKWNTILGPFSLFWKKKYLRDPFPEFEGTEWRLACFRREHLKLLSRNAVISSKTQTISVTTNLNPNDQKEVSVSTPEKPKKFVEPTSSPDGRKIAYSEITKHGYFVTISNFDGTDSCSIKTTSPPFYYYWSPNSRYVAWLSNFQDTMTFQVIDIKMKPIKSVELGQGRPFFFAFSSDSSKLLTHVAHTEIRLFEAPYDENSRKNSQLVQDQIGFFMAPKWIPNSNELYLASIRYPNESQALAVCSLATNSVLDYLVIAKENERIWFQLSPDGKKIACSITQPEEAEQLIVFDFHVSPHGPTSQSIGLAKERGDLCKSTVNPSSLIKNKKHIATFIGKARAYFWSPDSTKLAYLDTTDQLVSLYHFFNLNSEQLMWNIYDVATETRRQIGEVFTASNRFSQYVAFFDQYSLSLRLWSNDSQNLVCASREGTKVYSTDSNSAPVLHLETDNSSFSWT